MSSALTPEDGARVVVGLSGGVDSAVTALLLKRQGCAVSAIFMKNWEDDDDEEYCAARADLIDAAAICDRLDIELDVVNFAAEYKERVFSDFLREYKAGRTPNPDVLCNSEIKFRCFLDHALQSGADRVATGHYARIMLAPGERKQYQLLKASDSSKDQSYFLHRLNQSQLARSLFPLGELQKSEVRHIAREAGLPVADKRDSTGICFIGERPFRDFLARYLPIQRGEIRALDDNRLLGEHMGVIFHTIGQRKGLHIGGQKGEQQNGNHEAWYVAAKSIADNILYVVQGHQHPALLQTHIAIGDTHWIAGQPPQPTWVYSAKPRYRTPDEPCVIESLDETGRRAQTAFATPVWAAAPGQSLVLYESQVCLGGGIILAPEPA